MATTIGLFVFFFFGKMKFICQMYTLFQKVFDDSLGVFLEPDSRLFAYHIIGCGEGADCRDKHD
jgi:hypothetical protein